MDMPKKTHRVGLLCSRSWSGQSLSFAAALCLILLLPFDYARADTVVTDGKFTNVYVFPDPDKETWEQHLNSLPPDQKPSDADKFTRSSIDSFVQTIMAPSWPSFFSALHQYGGINPPRFFGSSVASQACVDAAMKDRHNGVLEEPTIRSLSNCHLPGKDPSPQVNLIFSPDIKIGDVSVLTANGPDICAEGGSHHVAWHSKGLNTPDFAVLPTSPGPPTVQGSGCAASFAKFTETVSHEDVEMLTDPGYFGHGGLGGTELGDRCQSIDTNWNGYNVQRYRSDSDNVCWPLAIPFDTSCAVTVNMPCTVTWVLAESSPVIRFTGSVHTLTLNVPSSRSVTTAAPQLVQLFIQTGSDDLRGGSNSGDNANALVTFQGRRNSFTANINGSGEWGNGQTHMANLVLPSDSASVADISSVTITTGFSGGTGGDNWNVDKVALMIAFPAGSNTSGSTSLPVIHEWLDVSGGPLIRFTGKVHDLTETIAPQDLGTAISALSLVISTGNDDLRGGHKPEANCNVEIALTNGTTMTINNINNGNNWKNWTDHSVAVPLPAEGLKGGDIKQITLHTGFGGGVGGDNWNVQRVRLQATLK